MRSSAISSRARGITTPRSDPSAGPPAIPASGVRPPRLISIARRCETVASLFVLGAADCSDIMFDRDIEDSFPVGRYHAVKIMAVDRIEFEGCERRANSTDLFRRERNQIGVAAHEAQVFGS